MPSQPSQYLDPAADVCGPSPRRDRAAAASSLLEFDEARRRGSSQRAAAEKAGVPRSTLRYWSDRRRGLALPEEVAAFLETPTGLAWLHRLVMAAIFVMTLRGPEGVRVVCEFLELSGLAGVLGASFGSIQKLTLQMQEEVAAFGEGQREVLGQNMPTKAITVCEDETFHPKTCLVAIDPASNFILVERYVERRDLELDAPGGSARPARPGGPVHQRPGTGAPAPHAGPAGPPLPGPVPPPARPQQG